MNKMPRNFKLQTPISIIQNFQIPEKTSLPISEFPRRIVESVGPEVTELSEGDAVIPVFLSDCGECSDCRLKKSNLCSKLPFEVSPWMPRDGTSRFTDLGGNTVHHFLSASSFSEYTVVDVRHLTKIDAPDDVQMNRACILGCCVSTGVGAAWRTADVEEGSTVVIFGLGSIGLAVADGARMRGAARIIGVDMKAEKFEIGENLFGLHSLPSLEHAKLDCQDPHIWIVLILNLVFIPGKKFGVTEFVNPGDCGDKPLSQVINGMTGGADYCFECVGLPFLMEEAYACCRKGWGKTIILGVAGRMSEIKFKCFEVLNHGKILTGSLFGGLKPKSDIPMLLKRYMDKKLELGKYVTYELDFKDITRPSICSFKASLSVVSCGWTGNA